MAQAVDVRTEGEGQPGWLDPAASGLAVLLVGGFYLDLWAHSHGRVDDTFFTPWHGVLYAGAGLFGGVLLALLVARVRAGSAWRSALPRPYAWALVGAGLFLVAGIGDLIWHEAFGFEEEIEDLLSPTHLVLAAGGMLMAAAPLRSVWARGVPGRWPAALPWVLSLTMAFSILTAFTSYAHPATGPLPSDEAVERNPSELLVVDPATGVRSVVPTDGDVHTPAVAPDGRIVATLYDAEAESGRLVVLDESGAVTATLDSGDSPYNHPEVSGDGMVVFNARVGDSSRIFMVPIDGGEPVRLTEGDQYEWSPSWSPDGQRVVYTVWDGDQNDMWMVEVADGSTTRLTDLPGNEVAPAWSPDGSTIAFERSDGGPSDLWVIAPDGTGERQLTDAPGWEIAPSWAPDGSAIAFSANIDETHDLWLVDPASGEVTPAATVPGSDAGWAGIGWGPNGRIVTQATALPAPWTDRVTRDVRVVVAMLIQAALIAGVIFLVRRRGPAPLGTYTLLFGANGALMTVFADRYLYVAAALAAGVTADLLARRRPATLGFVVPMVWYAVYLVAAAVVEGGLAWAIHMTLGAPLLAGVVGLLLSVVVFRDEPPVVVDDGSGPVDDEAAGAPDAAEVGVGG